MTIENLKDHMPIGSQWKVGYKTVRMKNLIPFGIEKVLRYEQGTFPFSNQDCIVLGSEKTSEYSFPTKVNLDNGFSADMDEKGIISLFFHGALIAQFEQVV